MKQKIENEQKVNLLMQILIDILQVNSLSVFNYVFIFTRDRATQLQNSIV